MRVVYKYTLSSQLDKQRVMMPVGAKIVHVDTQVSFYESGESGHVFVLWAEVEVDSKREERYFRIYATGETFEYEGTHLGTIVMGDGQFVWHVYEVAP